MGDGDSENKSSWWDTITTPFSYAWSGIKTSARVTSEVVSAIWNGRPLAFAASSMAHSSYALIQHTANQAPAAIETGHVIATDSDVRKALGKVTTVVVQDYLPMFLVNFVFLELAGYASALVDEENEAFFGANFILNNLYMLLVVGNGLYQIYKSTSSEPRNVIAGVQVSGAFNKATDHPIDRSLLKKGPQLTDPMSYTARFLGSKALISGTGLSITILESMLKKDATSSSGFIFPALRNFVFGLNAYHDGQLITRSALDGLSEADRARYLVEFRELAMSLGATKTVTAYLLSQAADYLSFGYLPSKYTRWVIDSLLTHVYYGIVANMNKPRPKPKEDCHRIEWVDPLWVVDKITLEVGKIVVEGSVKVVPKWFQNDNKLNWRELSEEVGDALSDKRLATLRKYCLPKMYHNWDNFSEDPIIKDNFKLITASVSTYVGMIRKIKDLDPELQQLLDKHAPKFIASLIAIMPENFKRGVLNTALDHPKTLQKGLKKAGINLPPGLVKFLAELLKDQYFILDLQRLNRWLSKYGDGIEDFPEVVITTPGLAFANDTTTVANVPDKKEHVDVSKLVSYKPAKTESIGLFDTLTDNELRRRKKDEVKVSESRVTLFEGLNKSPKDGDSTTVVSRGLFDSLSQI
jgi:hypothetical protein